MLRRSCPPSACGLLLLDLALQRPPRSGFASGLFWVNAGKEAGPDLKESCALSVARDGACGWALQSEVKEEAAQPPGDTSDAVPAPLRLSFVIVAQTTAGQPLKTKL